MKRLLVLVILLALAAGYWLYQRPETVPDQTEPREVAPQRWQVGTSQPGAEVNATMLDNSTNASDALDSNASLLDNATLALIPSDDLVRHEFVHDAATYFVDLYLPAGSQKNPSGPGRLNLNIKALNLRYGVDFFGLAVDPVETLESRKRIFQHVLQGPVLDFLHAAYLPLFLNNLDQALQTTTYTAPDGQPAAITAEQRREMMTMLAARLQAVGHTVGVLARNDSIRPMVSTYLENQDKVAQAHLAFWNLQNEGASPLKLNEGSAQIKSSIQNRELSRQRLLQTIASLSPAQGLDASELIYLAQWVYRRGLEDEKSLATVAKAGDLLVRTAVALEERSRLNPSEQPASPEKTLSEE